MLSKNKVSIQEVLLWLFAIAPVIVVACNYHSLPLCCIVRIDGGGGCHYGARSILCILSLLPTIFVSCITMYIHSGKRKGRPNVEVQRIAMSIIVFILGYVVALILRNFNVDIIEIYNLACFSISILFATIGGALLKDRKDNPLEIKNAWTMADISVMDKTNTLAGNMCVVGGFIQALCSIFLRRKQLLFYVMILVFMACLVVPSVMSYVWFKKNNK